MKSSKENEKIVREKGDVSTVENDRARIRDWALNEILDRMRTDIYVTDLDTDEILFMSGSMKKAFGVEHPEGRKCWEVLQREQRGKCEFCPVDRLNRNDPDHSVCVWEEHNSKNGHIYQNYDSLMRWTDGRLVHFQHSVDITEERRMTQAANYDELTGALSRRAGKEILQEKLDRGDVFALCLLDVNGLKVVNDTRGHQAGDAFLIEIVDAIRDELRPQDYLFRMSGDEFVVIIDGADREAAAAVMSAAQKKLRGADEEEARFCYGIAEKTEGAERTAAGLLGSADAALYYFKRKLHIRQAEAKAKQNVGAASASDRFEYDASLLYDALVKSTEDYLYVCNMKTGAFRYPQAMVDDFDLPGQVIENAAAVWGAKVHEHDKTAFMEANQDITEGRTDCHSVEYRARNAKGEWQWMRCRGHVARNRNGEPALFAGFISNLGKKDKIDHLTGLFNQIAFKEECERLLASGGVTAMIFGIDDLKRVNSLYNREFGDEVVRIVSQRVQSYLPPQAKIYRLEGDEFGVLIAGTERGVARSFFYAVKEAFSAQQTFDDKKFFCTLSCGCAIAGKSSVDYQELRKRASCALDYAKRNGKNRIEFYSSTALASMERGFILTELLRESVEKNFEGFRLVFQPIFDSDLRVKGAETLCRWSTPRYGEIPPTEFIPLLENSGLIVRVGKWVFRQAAKRCAEYLAADADFHLSINLSWLQLEDISLPDYMRRILDSYGVPPGKVGLELTESYLASNFRHISGLLEKLREAGFRIAMDDFGTGYSSLGLLKQAPIDDVKLDSMFVRDIGQSSFNRSFVRMAVELCHIVGITVCIEGVETDAEYEQIRSLGADFMQGFLFGLPCEAENFAERYLNPSVSEIDETGKRDGCGEGSES